MKLINYDYGHSLLGDTYYRGKILMNYDEYKEVVRFLLRSRLGARYENSFLKRLLREDLKKQVSVKGNGFIVAVRVTATEKIVAKYQLKRYKRQNYFIHVTP